MFLIVGSFISNDDKMSSSKKEKISLELTFKGKECHEIRLTLREKIKTIEIGTILKMSTDNPKSIINIPKWCQKNKQELFLVDIKNGLNVFYIKRLN